MDQACFGGGTRTTEYVECRFDGSKITAVAPGMARFVRCSFKQCVIRSFFGTNVAFVDCVFSGRIEHAAFYGSAPERDRSISARSRNEFR